MFLIGFYHIHFVSLVWGSLDRFSKLIFWTRISPWQKRHDEMTQIGKLHDEKERRSDCVLSSDVRGNGNSFHAHNSLYYDASQWNEVIAFSAVFWQVRINYIFQATSITSVLVAQDVLFRFRIWYVLNLLYLSDDNKYLYLLLTRFCYAQAKNYRLFFKLWPRLPILRHNSRP